MSELCGAVLARELAGAAGTSEEPTPLLFVSGMEKRWISNAPHHWWDLCTDHLLELLEHAREFPAWVGTFLGHFDE